MIIFQWFCMELCCNRNPFLCFFFELWPVLDHQICRKVASFSMTFFCGDDGNGNDSSTNWEPIVHENLFRVSSSKLAGFFWITAAKLFKFGDLLAVGPWIYAAPLVGFEGFGCGFRLCLVRRVCTPGLRELQRVPGLHGFHGVLDFHGLHTFIL